MAKMFYTLDEAAAKLGMDESDVQSLAESGQLQEFRDRDKLMFKVEQVDLLAGDGEHEEEITLADTGTSIEGISLSSTGSATSLSLEASGDATGISIFEPEDGDAVDANADTLVSGGALGGSGFGSGFNMDAGASGSGLAQLAFEPDDTSLGGNLLDDLAADSQAGASQGGSAIGDTAFGGSVAGALFEGTSSAESDFTPAPAMAPMAGAEVYDGAASGLFGGAALGMVVLMMVSLAVMILGMTGGSQQLLDMVDTNMLYMIAGGGAGVVVIFAIIGWVALRKS
ncbi:MAG: helix-turn-helix domain-containing protein [Phycisphaerales bacterium]